MHFNEALKKALGSRTRDNATFMVAFFRKDWPTLKPDGSTSRASRFGPNKDNSLRYWLSSAANPHELFGEDSALGMVAEKGEVFYAQHNQYPKVVDFLKEDWSFRRFDPSSMAWADEM